jgi:hypothetical protein
MAHFEYALLTALCDNAKAWRVVRDKLKPEHFVKVDAQAVWRFIMRHVVDHGLPPSREILHDRFPQFPFEASADAPTSLAERVHAAFLYRRIAEQVERVMQLAGTDPVAAAQAFADGGSAIRVDLNATQGKTGADITKQMDEEYEAYLRVANAQGLLGMAYPWEILNRRTLGLEGGQFVGWHARPKIGKTFYLMFLALWFHYKYNKRVICFSREMGVRELRRRAIATVAEVDYDRYTHGKLTDPELARYHEAREVFAERKSFFIDNVESNGAAAADEMAAKAADFGADLWCVDGVYFFGDREWDEIARFTSRAKQHLLSMQIPGILTTQSNKKGEVGYSDAILQDVDMLITMTHDPDEPNRMHMKTAGMRDGKPASWQVWRKPCVDFGQAHTDPEDAADSGEPPPDVEL